MPCSVVEMQFFSVILLSLSAGSVLAARSIDGSCGGKIGNTCLGSGKHLAHVMHVIY